MRASENENFAPSIFTLLAGWPSLFNGRSQITVGAPSFANVAKGGYSTVDSLAP